MKNTREFQRWIVKIYLRPLSNSFMISPIIYFSLFLFFFFFLSLWESFRFRKKFCATQRKVLFREEKFRPLPVTMVNNRKRGVKKVCSLAQSVTLFPKLLSHQCYPANVSLTLVYPIISPFVLDILCSCSTIRERLLFENNNRNAIKRRRFNGLEMKLDVLARKLFSF